MYEKEVAIGGLAALGIAALYKGIDSALLVTIAGIIAGIAGYKIGSKGSDSGRSNKRAGSEA